MLNDKLISWLRTVLPYAWSLLVAWLVSHGLPHEVTDWLSGMGEQITNLVIAGVLYGFARWVEPYLPGWLNVLFFGSPATPTYLAARSEE
jgi:hypothetical protein